MMQMHCSGNVSCASACVGDIQVRYLTAVGSHGSTRRGVKKIYPNFQVHPMFNLRGFGVLGVVSDTGYRYRRGNSLIDNEMND